MCAMFCTYLHDTQFFAIVLHILCNSVVFYILNNESSADSTAYILGILCIINIGHWINYAYLLDYYNLDILLPISCTIFVNLCLNFIYLACICIILHIFE